MSKYAIMNGDEVINVALWDGATPWESGDEVFALPDDSPVGPGWTRDGGEWVAPPLSKEEQAAIEEAAARQAAKESVRAKLAALGLDADEIDVLV